MKAKAERTAMSYGHMPWMKTMSHRQGRLWYRWFGNKRCFTGEDACGTGRGFGNKRCLTGRAACGTGPVSHRHGGLCHPLSDRQGRLWYRLMLAVGLALVITLTGCAEWSQLARRIENPGLAGSAARGKTLYLASGCPSCHGDTGQGNGPESAAVRVRIPDFTDRARMVTRSDPDLFWAIDRGRDRTGMPGYGKKLSDSEIWDLVNYVRSLY